MNTYEFVTKRRSTPLDCTALVSLMYKRYVKDMKETGNVVQPIEFFIFENFTRYFWNRGDLVSYESGEDSGIYIVTGWDSGWGDRNDNVIISCGESRRENAKARDLVKAEVPPAILEIARSQLRVEGICPDLSRCPLKKEGVCMEGENE